MRRTIVTLVGAVVLGFAAIAALFMAGMRTNYPPVQDRVRRFNRAVVNPRMMKTAGQPGVGTAAIRHVGRTSGQAYETPVDVEATDDGFVVALPYGTKSDWLKNVLAAGSATIVDDGTTYQVDQPQVVPTSEALPHFPAKTQRTLRLFGVGECLKLRRVEPPA